MANTVFRTCPDTGLKFNAPAENLIKANAVAAVVFLLSEAAAFITGSCIRIDGGVPNARHTWTLHGSNPQSAAVRPYSSSADPNVSMTSSARLASPTGRAIDALRYE